MSAFQRQQGVMKELAQMVRDHIFRTILKKAPKERIEEMLRGVKCNKSVEIFRFGPEFGVFDLLDLVDAAGIDIGFTIRTRNGEEVTFYPAHNFGGTGGKNGTPQEKRVAKKPYEYSTPSSYPHHTPYQPSAANPGRHNPGVYAQLDDDDEAGAIGPQQPKTGLELAGESVLAPFIKEMKKERKPDDTPCG